MKLQAGLPGVTASCNRLSIRARTTVCQKLSADFQAEVDSFREFIEKQVLDFVK